MMKNPPKDLIVYQASLLLIQHFKNLLDYGKDGFNSRIFQYMLHREYDFVGVGYSVEAIAEKKFYPEHVVPCSFLIDESKRLIKEGVLSLDEIAALLQKHWKIVRITPDQANYIDFDLGYRSTMPEGWCFETGDPLARLKAANITIKDTL